MDSIYTYRYSQYQILSSSYSLFLLIDVREENLLCIILSVKIFVIKTTLRMLFNPAWRVLSWIIADKYTEYRWQMRRMLLLTSNTALLVV